MSEQAPGRVRARVKVEPVKIHGPNSPEVLAGNVPLWHREAIAAEPERFVELTEKDVRELFGDEAADEWFPKGEK